MPTDGQEVTSRRRPLSTLLSSPPPPRNDRLTSLRLAPGHLAVHLGELLGGTALIALRQVNTEETHATSHRMRNVLLPAPRRSPQATS